MKKTKPITYNRCNSCRLWYDGAGTIHDSMPPDCDGVATRGYCAICYDLLEFATAEAAHAVVTPQPYPSPPLSFVLGWLAASILAVAAVAFAVAGNH